MHNASTVPAGSSKDFEEKPPHELEEPTIVEGPEEEPSSELSVDVMSFYGVFRSISTPNLAD